MNPFSRSSLATGPKMRVPMGLSASVSMTAAFSSKRMCVPSGRRVFFTTLTMTAFTTLPARTASGALGMASFTEHVMMSPSPA